MDPSVFFYKAKQGGTVQQENEAPTHHTWKVEEGSTQEQL